MVFIIPDDTFDDFNSAISQYERSITLTYPEIKTECPNCSLDTMGTRNRSISKYKDGGPMPFTNGMPCPYCDGKGYIESVTTESVPARIYLEPEQWAKTVNIKIPKGSIMTIFEISYSTKVRKCKYMSPQYNQLEDHFTDNYYRIGDIYSNSFVLNPVKYATAFWGKNNG